MITKNKLFLTALATISFILVAQASEYSNPSHLVYKTVLKGGNPQVDSVAYKQAREMTEFHKLGRKTINQQADEDYKQVTILYNYDPALYSAPYMVDLINVETLEDYVYFFDEEPKAIIDVVPGTYMTYANFLGYNDNPQRIIVKESIVVDKDTTIIFDPEEATNFQEHIMYTHSGEQIQLGLSKRYNEEPWFEKISEGNVSMASVQTSIYYEDLELINNISIISDNYIEENGDITNTMGLLSYYINDVSDKVSALSFGLSYDNAQSSADVFLFENKKQNSSNIYENNPADFVLLDNSDTELPYASSMSGLGVAYKFDEEAGYFFNISWTESAISKYYFGKTSSDNLHISNIFVLPASGYEDMESWTQYISYLAPTYNQEGILAHAVYAYPNTMYFPAYGRNTYNGGTISPHPYFTFRHDQQGGSAFDNVPILVSTNSFIASDKIWEANIEFGFSYIGNYGEQTDLGSFLGVIEYKKDGEIIATNFGEMQEFQWSIYDNGIESAWGEYEINATYPVMVDGIEGGNTTTMKFSYQNGVDVNSPTVQMLQLRKEDGTVTTRFAEGESVQLSVAGGDYVFDNTYPKSHNYVPAAIKVEYSPYKADQWMDVAVEANPELLDVPGMGDTYQGTISDLPVSQNNWYDLRLTVVDAAGNSQQQTLTAAFRVDNATSISTLKPAVERVAYDVYGRKSTSGKGLLICNGKIITVK